MPIDVTKLDEIELSELRRLAEQEHNTDLLIRIEEEEDERFYSQGCEPDGSQSEPVGRCQ